MTVLSCIGEPGVLSSHMCAFSFIIAITFLIDNKYIKQTLIVYYKFEYITYILQNRILQYTNEGIYVRLFGGGEGKQLILIEQQLSKCLNDLLVLLLTYWMMCYFGMHS